MRVTKLIWCALCAAFFGAFCLLGCEELDPYAINAPSDLQKKIDSIAAVKAGRNTGDTTFLTIATAIVGAEDNSAGWWTSFSDYFSVPSGKLLHLEFVNNGTGINNWNNWNLALANVPDRDDATYAEYFLLRSDGYGWGNSDFNINMIDHNYADLNLDGDEDIWNDFRANMQGAYVSMDIDHSATGNAFITVTSVSTTGKTLIETYQQPVSATADIVAFLVCDGSHFLMKKAYLLPSRVTAIADVNAASIEVDGVPEFVELGNENFWGSAKATVTFADGSSAEVDSTDIAFSVIPDMTTLGEKTVIVAYSKTKKGAFGPPVSTLYKLEVTNAVRDLEVTTAPTITEYHYFASDSIIFNTAGLVVTATYSDGSTGVLPKQNLKFSKIPAADGGQEVKISYVGATSTVTTAYPINVVKGVAQVGATDLSTLWWTTFSSDYAIASGTSKTITMYCYSKGAENYQSPSTILRKADKTEYAVVRMDHFGWGSGYPTAVATSDWDWATFKPNITGSKIVIKVTNNGNNTADILYNVTYANGETHFQKYAGVTIDSSDLNAALVIEGAYVVITE